MKVAKKISNLVFTIEKAIVAILLFIGTLSLIAGVFCRYFFNNPLNWTEEIAIYSLAWITFVGGSMALKDKQSAVISLLLDRVRGKAYSFLVAICNIIVILFSAYIFVISIQWVASPTILVEKSAAMQLPMIIPYLSVPVGFGFMTIHSIYLFLEELPSSITKVSSTEKNAEGSQNITNEVMS